MLVIIPLKLIPFPFSPFTLNTRKEVGEGKGGESFAVDVPALAEFLGSAGLSPRASERNVPLAPEDLANLAADMAVRVSCWR